MAARKVKIRTVEHVDGRKVQSSTVTRPMSSARAAKGFFCKQTGWGTKDVQPATDKDEVNWANGLGFDLFSTNGTHIGCVVHMGYGS